MLQQSPLPVHVFPTGPHAAGKGPPSSRGSGPESVFVVMDVVFTSAPASTIPPPPVEPEGAPLLLFPDPPASLPPAVLPPLPPPPAPLLPLDDLAPEEPPLPEELLLLLLLLEDVLLASAPLSVAEEPDDDDEPDDDELELAPGSAQTPIVHSPVQHSMPDMHSDPFEAHEAPWQVPARQLRLQHCVLSEHAAPWLVQDGAAQEPAAHLRLQQSVPWAQLPPAGTHGSTTQTPLSQSLLQQSLGAAHAAPSAPQTWAIPTAPPSPPGTTSIVVVDVQAMNSATVLKATAANAAFFIESAVQQRACPRRSKSLASFPSVSKPRAKCEFDVRGAPRPRVGRSRVGRRQPASPRRKQGHGSTGCARNDCPDLLSRFEVVRLSLGAWRPLCNSPSTEGHHHWPYATARMPCSRRSV